MSFTEPLAIRRPILKPGGKIVVVVLLILLLAGEQVFYFLDRGESSSARLAHGAPIPPTLAGKIGALLKDALGPGDRGVRRYRIDAITREPGHLRLNTVSITWAINGDLSLGSVSAGAQLELYLVLRALYTAHLPIGSVQMIGTFGQRATAGHSSEVPVIRVNLDRAFARLIDWSTVDATTLWPLLHRTMIQPGFECQCQE